MNWFSAGLFVWAFTAKFSPPHMINAVTGLVPYFVVAALIFAYLDKRSDGNRRKGLNATQTFAILFLVLSLFSVVM